MELFYKCLLNLVGTRRLPSKELSNVYFSDFLDMITDDSHGDKPTAQITWDYRNGKFGLDYETKDIHVRIKFKLYGNTWYIWGANMQNDPDATKDQVLFRGINRYIAAKR